eukprot:15043399-Alexandrium_andersonii.AAC.1
MQLRAGLSCLKPCWTLVACHRTPSHIRPTGRPIGRSTDRPTVQQHGQSTTRRMQQAMPTA